MDASHIAADAIGALAERRFAEVRSRFAPPLQKRVTAQALAAAWAEHVEKHGAVRSVGTPELRDTENAVIAAVPFETEQRDLVATVTIDPLGQLLNIQVVPNFPPWAPPAYADPASFEERELELATPAGAVGATLSLPNHVTQVPAAILLAGGGPFDRDMTAGANRIGKDLAWGLASRGIAVLRVDKPSFAHPDAAGALTPTDDYLPPTAEALALLRSNPAIDPNRIILVGHSMGAKWAPRVAARTDGVAGLVMLAADAEPMEQSAIRVTRYLAELPAAPPEAARLARLIKRQARRVTSRRLTADTPPARLPFGYSGRWWLDVRGYDAVDTAVRLPLPMLLLQGARDYQVTVDGDLALWSERLAARADVRIRVLHADDHLFFPGVGPSTPSGYEPPQHVDPQVIDEVAAWVGTL